MSQVLNLLDMLCTTSLYSMGTSCTWFIAVSLSTRLISRSKNLLSIYKKIALRPKIYVTKEDYGLKKIKIKIQSNKSITNLNFKLAIRIAVCLKMKI